MGEYGWQVLANQLAARGERRLVLVEGQHEQVLTRVRQILSDLAPEAGLWVGQATSCAHPGLTIIGPGQARQYLGTEHPVLVWDGWQGNPPDALAALSGTLPAGGLWFWLMPPLAEWGEFADPDYDRMGLPPEGHHPFMARLARILAQTPTLIRLTSAGDQPPALAESDSSTETFRPANTDDQTLAVERIVQTGQGRRRRPLVITSDRGRGKSAALGMAAVRLLQAGRRHIAVVSPRRESVTTLFCHAAASGGQVDDGQGRLTLDDGATLAWYPVDELLARRPEAELVMVDEAAAIPAPLLRQILLGWPRVVFASTVHGYEGSGRGFNLRFRAVLDRETPHWQSLTLTRPIRWGPGDPLEPLVNQMFLLDSEEAAIENQGSVSIEAWRPGAAGDAELAQAFGLLVDAHYRTTPGDLRQWAEDPRAVTLVARQQGAVVGVLWATMEGGLAPDLAEKVLRGERRLKGHLLPQSLANHGGDAVAATLRMLRVVRVAVHDQCRRQGIGRDLLGRATTTASSLGLDAIGTSFGAAEELMPFWQSCGFATVRLGISREASSGEYAVQMLKGLSAQGQITQQRLSMRFSEQWPVMLPVVWSSLSAELVLAITADLPQEIQLTAQERTELDAFAYGHRGFELSLPALKRLSVQAQAADRLRASDDDVRLWVSCVLQDQGWDAVRMKELCTGRKDGESRLRLLAGKLLGR